MASETQSNMLRLLRPDLAALAVDLSDIAGSCEYCFPLAAAPAVLEDLLANGVIVLGGDLWDLDSSGYYSSGEGWYTDSMEGETVENREERIETNARTFFSRYRYDDSKRVAFVVKPI